MSFKKKIIDCFVLNFLFYRGADLANLVQVARESCLEEIIAATSPTDPCPAPVVNLEHFERAFESVSASVDAEVSTTLTW